MLREMCQPSSITTEQVGKYIDTYGFNENRYDLQSQRVKVDCWH